VRLAVAFLPEELDYRADDAVIIVDAVRAGATLTVIAANGNPLIFLADNAQAALDYRNTQRPDAWAGGEQDGLPLPGFQFGNSPREVANMDFAGHEVVFGTVNGTRAARLASAAKYVSIASFLNVTAAAESAMHSRPESVKVVCAGSHRLFTLDDGVCAGLVAKAIRSMGVDAEDSALASIALADKYSDLSEMMRISDSGRRLMSIGLEGDLDFCAQVDYSSRVPLLSKNVADSRSRLITI
jgi:2-phosphosulfolactate phosphatase